MNKKITIAFSICGMEAGNRLQTSIRPQQDLGVSQKTPMADANSFLLPCYAGYIDFLEYSLISDNGCPVCVAEKNEMVQDHAVHRTAHSQFGRWLFS
jgi:hypothetical protein